MECFFHKTHCTLECFKCHSFYVQRSYCFKISYLYVLNVWHQPKSSVIILLVSERYKVNARGIQEVF